MTERMWIDVEKELIRDVVPTASGMAYVTEVLADTTITSEADAIEIIARAEELKAAAAAAQARATAVLDLLRRSREQINGLPRERQGRGLAQEVALARRESPSMGDQHLRAARILVDDLPYTLARMETGELTEDKALRLVREVADLAGNDRRVVDTELAGEITRLSAGQVTDRARRIAMRLDADAAAERQRAAHANRRVTVRHAPEPGMAFLTAHLPVIDARRVYDRLTQEADTILAVRTTSNTGTNTDAGTAASGAADRRARGQVVADLLVEHLTGTPVAAPRHIDLTLVMSDATLLGGPEPGWVPGQGPLPAPSARALIDPERAGTVELRRIWTDPVTGIITATDSRARTFSATARRALAVRDDVCRTPYCGAPIRQADHAIPWAAGGRTTLTNASGLCQRCNLTKEHEGWAHQATSSELTVRTPTGHTYQAPASHLARPDLNNLPHISLHRHGAGGDRRPPPRPGPDANAPPDTAVEPEESG